MTITSSTNTKASETRSRWFKLSRIPDLNLARYAAQAESTVAGVVDSFDASLKPLHRLGLCYGLRMHLVFAWHPDALRGKRLTVSLGFSGRQDQLDAAPLEHLLSSLPFYPYFGSFLEEVEAPLSSGHWQGLDWSAANVGVQVAKVERFLEPIAVQETDEKKITSGSFNRTKLHVIESWKGRSDSRLIGLLKLLGALNKVALLIVTLEPTEKTELLTALYENSLTQLRNYSSNRYARGLLTDHFKQLPQDPHGEEVLKLREDLLENLQESPHFQTAITCWTEQDHIARLLAETSVAEALESGAHTIFTLDALDPWQCLLGELPAACSKETPDQLKFLPHLFTLDEIKGFFRLPVLHEGESLDLPKETDAALVLKQTANGIEDALPIGYLLSSTATKTEQELTIPVQNLTKHALIVGVPGSGKTNTLMFLAWQLWKKHGVPFLILEPAKREYRGLKNIDDNGDVSLFTPGRPHPGISRSNDFLQFKINPFQFPKHVSLAEHAMNLLACFEGAFPLFAPLPAMVERAIGRVYQELAWQMDDVNDGKRTFPTMGRFVEVLKEEVEAAQYSGEVAGNLKAALDMRFSRLTSGLVGYVFNNARSSLEPEEWLESPVIIELESLGSNYANFLTLLLLTQIREVLSVSPEKRLRHLLVLEEAHNLIGPESVNRGGEADPLTAATAYIVKLLAEVRALGQGIIIADQLPSKLASEVLKNTSLKICQRLTAMEDRNQMGQTMQASDAQLEQVASLLPGQALVSFEGLLKPFFSTINLADIDMRHLNDLPTDKQILQY